MARRIMQEASVDRKGRKKTLDISVRKRNYHFYASQKASVTTEAEEIAVLLLLR